MERKKLEQYEPPSILFFSVIMCNAVSLNKKATVYTPTIWLQYTIQMADTIW